MRLKVLKINILNGNNLIKLKCNDVVKTYKDGWYLYGDDCWIVFSGSCFKSCKKDFEYVFKKIDCKWIDKKTAIAINLLYQERISSKYQNDILYFYNIRNDERMKNYKLI